MVVLPHPHRLSTPPMAPRRAESPPPDFYSPAVAGSLGAGLEHGPHTGCPVHSPFRYWLDEHGVPGPSYQSYLPPAAAAAAAIPAAVPRQLPRFNDQFVVPQPPRPFSRTLHRRNTQPVRPNGPFGFPPVDQSLSSWSGPMSTANHLAIRMNSNSRDFSCHCVPGPEVKCSHRILAVLPMLTSERNSFDSEMWSYRQANAYAIRETTL